MDLYKEQRFEIKGLPNVENHGTPQVSPSHLVKVDNNDDVNDAMKGNSSIETADVKIGDVSDSGTSQKEPDKVSSHVDAGMEIETQDGGGSSPNPEKSPEAVEAVASDHNEGYEQDAKPDDGAGGVDQTMETAPEHDGIPMETAPEHDGIPEGDVTLTIASPALVAMEIDERNDLSEDKNMEEAEEKKEADDGDGDVSPKVTETLVHESDESVISRIHHSPQSTH